MKPFTGPSKSIYIDEKGTRVYSLLPVVHAKFREWAIKEEKEAELNEEYKKIIEDSI